MLRKRRPRFRTARAALAGLAFALAGCARVAADASVHPLDLSMIASVPLPGAATRFDYASLDPVTHRLFVAHLAASEVVVFDVATDRVVGRIPDVSEVHGVLAVPQLGRLYATATGTNEVVAIDARSLHVIARMPGGSYPDGMAYDPADHKLFVSDENGDTDTVIDTRTNARIATIPLGGDVGNTQYDARTRRAYVNDQTHGDLIAIDPTSDTIVARYHLSGCAGNHGLAIDDRTRRAYIACEDDARLVVFDFATMTQTQTLPLGSGPDVLARDPDLARLYVASESGVVSIFSTRGARVRETSHAYLAENAHVVAVDPRTHRVYFPVLSPTGPRMLVMMPSPRRPQ